MSRRKKAHADLVKASDVPISRHIKVRAIANPYDLAFADYFVKREEAKRLNQRSVPS